MSHYTIASRATEDLWAIWSHMAQHSPAAANRWLDTMEVAFERLAEYPELGHLRPDLTPRDLRFFSTQGATVIYRYQPLPVQILRVAGRGRDLGTVLE